MMTSKEKILQSAKEVFIKKGKVGARIDEIAKKANINKAMIYYYFKSKDDIYKEILKNSFSECKNYIIDIFSKNLSVEEKVEELVKFYINFYANKPDFLKLIFRELINESEDIYNILKELHDSTDIFKTNIIIKSFEEDIKNNKMREINLKHFMMSIIGMSLIYFLSKPLASAILNDQCIDENEFLEQRKKNIVDLILKGILIQR